MNFKVFSVICACLVFVAVLLAGSYYYLFEYQKPSFYTAKNTPSTNVPTNTTFNNHNDQNPSQVGHTLNSNPFQDNFEQNATQVSSLNEQDVNSTQSAEQEQDSKQSQDLSNQDALSQDSNISQSTQNQEQIAEQNLTSQNLDKTLEQKPSKANKPKKQSKPKKAKKLTIAQEYLQIGKNSRLEPLLSTDNMKVYILDGKFLSSYRIDLLKDMLSELDSATKDYNISVFVKILPNKHMNLSVYNKDIVFANKKDYKYIDIKDIQPYLSDLSTLNEHIYSNEILQRLKLQIKASGDGSSFAKHLRALKAGLNTSLYFFNFCEVIDISSVK